MKLVLLAAALLAAAPSSAAPASEGASSKGCCMRPAENPPRAPQKRTLCFGTMWSLAQPGHCSAEPGETSMCRENVFSTLVMVKEYNLTWDEKLKQCVLLSSGRAWPTVVSTCDGNSC